MAEIEQTVTERFAGRIAINLENIARIKFVGPHEDGILIVVSETRTGDNFSILITSDIEADENEVRPDGPEIDTWSNTDEEGNLRGGLYSKQDAD